MNENVEGESGMDAVSINLSSQGNDESSNYEKSRSLAAAQNHIGGGAIVDPLSAPMRDVNLEE